MYEAKILAISEKMSKNKIKGLGPTGIKIVIVVNTKENKICGVIVIKTESPKRL